MLCSVPRPTLRASCILRDRQASPPSRVGAGGAGSGTCSGICSGTSVELADLLRASRWRLWRLAGGDAGGFAVGPAVRGRTRPAERGRTAGAPPPPAIGAPLGGP